MFRLFLSFQACLLLTALAQPIDARDSLVYPTNPPKPVFPKQGFAPTSPVPQVTGPTTPTIFKIEKSDIFEAKAGQKELRASFIHSGSEPIDTADIKVVMYIYDSDAAGNLSLSESKVESEWTSGTVDWREDKNEETLALRFTAPPVDAGKKYSGYVLGIYYKDQLQDSRASSPDLLQKYPLP